MMLISQGTRLFSYKFLNLLLLAMQKYVNAPVASEFFDRLSQILIAFALAIVAKALPK